MIKRTFGTLTLLACLLGTTALLVPATQAQDMNAGYVLEEALILNMPQYQQVQQTLQQEVQTRQQQMQQQMQQMQQQVQRYQQQQSLLSEEKRTQREQELRQMQQDLQMQQQQQQQEMAQRQQELMEPLYQRLDDAEAQVAEAQGLDFVFRRQALAYISDDVVDITPAVASRLGIEVPDNPQQSLMPETGASTSPLGGN